MEIDSKVSPGIVVTLSAPRGPSDEVEPKSRGGRPPRGPWLRRSIIAFAVILVLWAIAAGLQLLSGASSAKSATDSLDSFSNANDGDMTSLTRLASSNTDLSGLHDAKDSITRARRSFGSPLLAPLRPLPVFGRQVRSAKALADASYTIAGATLDAFTEVQGIVESQDESPTTPEAAAERIHSRLTAATELELTLTRFKNRITGLDLGPKDGLFGTLTEARNKFATRYDEATATLDDAIAGVSATRVFLKGPENYLVLAANNAEMRAGSGMILQIGDMATTEGKFTLGGFVPTEGMFLPAPATTLDPTLEPLWGPLLPTQEWRNVNLTPRFDETARMATEMWRNTGRGEVSGALSIDVVGLKRLLMVSGPVTVTDDSGNPSTISAENVVNELLVKQYVALANQGQDERRAHLGDVAGAIFESFNNGDVALVDLMDALIDVGRGRHLMMWSSDPVQQAGWVALGLSGTLSENDLLLAVINRGGNKLDQFLDVSSQLTSRTSGTTRHLNVKVTLDNTSPEGLPTYIEGPVPGLGLSAGDYLGYLSLTVPGGSGNATATGAELVGTAIDGPTKVIVVKVMVPRGESLTVDIGFDLTSDWRTIDVLPSARFPTVKWTAGSLQWADKRAREIGLDKLD